MIRGWVLLVAVVSGGICANPSLSVSSVAGAQENDSPSAGVDVDDELATPTKAENANPAETDSLQTARRTLRTFIRSIEDREYRTAVSALDFSKLQPAPNPYEQVAYAQRLKACLDRLPLIDPSSISDEPEGPPVTFSSEFMASEIVLQRGDDAQWRFTADTVSQIDAMYDVLKDQSPIGANPTVHSESGTEPSEAEAEQAADEPDAEADGKLDSLADSAAVPDELSSARRTMNTLYDSFASNDYEAAVTALDFSRLEDGSQELSPWTKLGYARRLKEVLDRLAPIDYAEISDDPRGPTFHFPPVAVNQPIQIARGVDGGWRFSANTVARIDALHKLYRDKPIVNLPQEAKPWYDRELLLGNETWRIVALFGSIFACLLIGQILRGVLRWRVSVLERRQYHLRAAVLKTMATTVVGIFFLIGLRAGISGLILDRDVQAVARTVIHVTFAVVIGYVCFRLVDVAVEMLSETAKRSGSTLNNMLAPIVKTSLRLTIIVLVLLEIATAISDQPPSAVLAGLGAGGLAIGLAAQETIKNLFGSVMIFADGPFGLGERICVDGHDGPVESVGFRSTRLRTLEGHLVTIPNGEMANRTIQNIGKRPYIRRTMNIHIASDTPPDKIRQALAILRDLIADHEGKRDEHPPRVFLEDFLDAAINIRVIYWFHPPAYWDYCDFGEQLNLQIIEAYHSAGIRFALPSQRHFLVNEADNTQAGKNQ